MASGDVKGRRTSFDQDDGNDRKEQEVECEAEKVLALVVIDGRLPQALTDPGDRAHTLIHCVKEALVQSLAHVRILFLEKKKQRISTSTRGSNQD